MFTTLQDYKKEVIRMYSRLFEEAVNQWKSITNLEMISNRFEVLEMISLVLAKFGRNMVPREFKLFTKLCLRSNTSNGSSNIDSKQLHSYSLPKLLTYFFEKHIVYPLCGWGKKPLYNGMNKQTKENIMQLIKEILNFNDPDCLLLIKPFMPLTLSALGSTCAAYLACHNRQSITNTIRLHPESRITDLDANDMIFHDPIPFYLDLHGDDDYRWMHDCQQQTSKYAKKNNTHQHQHHSTSGKDTSFFQSTSSNLSSAQIISPHPPSPPSPHSHITHHHGHNRLAACIGTSVVQYSTTSIRNDLTWVIGKVIQCIPHTPHHPTIPPHPIHYHKAQDITANKSLVEVEAANETEEDSVVIAWENQTTSIVSYSHMRSMECLYNECFGWKSDPNKHDDCMGNMVAKYQHEKTSSCDPAVKQQQEYEYENKKSGLAMSGRIPKVSPGYSTASSPPSTSNHTPSSLDYPTSMMNEEEIHSIATATVSSSTTSSTTNGTTDSSITSSLSTDTSSTSSSPIPFRTSWSIPFSSSPPASSVVIHDPYEHHARSI